MKLKRIALFLLALTLFLPCLSSADEELGTVYNKGLPSLRDAYADYFDFGAAITGTEMNDISQLRGLSYQFSILTCGNEMKPEALLDVAESRKLAREDDTAVATRFNSCKYILKFAQGQGIKMHGHVLVWHSQTPEAFFHVGYDLKQPFVSREVMLARLENYIRQVMEYTHENFPGLIVSWDVVNEAVADNGPNELRESNWTKVVGQDFIERAFEYARKYAEEGTLLYYNDYSTPYEPKLTRICGLLDRLIAEGNIDGYGFQCHYSTGTPSMQQVGMAFARISAKGLRLRVSELDVKINANTEAWRNIQADTYENLFRIFLRYADKIEAVQVWGIVDSRSWLSTEYPLLFSGSHGYAKPAFYRLIQLAKTWEK